MPSWMPSLARPRPRAVTSAGKPFPFFTHLLQPTDPVCFPRLWYPRSLQAYTRALQSLGSALQNSAPGLPQDRRWRMRQFLQVLSMASELPRLTWGYLRSRWRVILLRTEHCRAPPHPLVRPLTTRPSICSWLRKGRCHTLSPAGVEDAMGFLLGTRPQLRHCFPTWPVGGDWVIGMEQGKAG